jgi:hypothetical protein
MQDLGEKVKEKFQGAKQEGQYQKGKAVEKWEQSK